MRALKGDGRPGQSADARAIVLAALADVSSVVVFDEDTPLELIQALKPDVLVKGGDYTKDQVVGRDVVEGGGRVVIVPLVPGASTSTILSRL